MDNIINFTEANSLERVDQEVGQSIVVPKGVRYISEWKEYDQKYFFPYPHIVDKKIPGCGYTEYCIRNSRDIILCSPRRVLLQNKFDQHPDEVFYAKNDLEVLLNIDKDYNSIGKGKYSLDKDLEAIKSEEEKISVQNEKQKEESIKRYKTLYYDLLEYRDRMRSHGKPMKILVTYDSYSIIKSILSDGANGLTGFGIFDQFYTVVDEFQSVFLDSIFKSTTELKFVGDLQGVQKVCYVSATPMIGSYLMLIPEFANLPYYYFDWITEQPERVTKPRLKVRTIDSLTKTIRGIVDSYKKGKGESRVVGTKMVTSQEAVIYLNSVNNICNTISRLDLAPEECNILCADTRENRQRLHQKLGPGWEIGRVPLRGESRKMFTFCTRTVYLGADFYSDNAKSFIISDANVDSMAVDISLDLPQILGRQRLTENPWKNEAEFYYIVRRVGKDNRTLEEIISKKMKTTETLLAGNKRAMESSDPVLISSEIEHVKNMDLLAKIYNYKKDYVAVNHVYNPTTKSFDLVPVENKLAYIAEVRSYDIQYKDYADRFSVFNTLERVLGSDSISERVKDFLSVYETLGSFYEKAKFLCDSDYLFSDGEIEVILDQIDPLISDSYRYIGKNRMTSYKYSVKKMKELLAMKIFDVNDLKSEVCARFSQGDRVSKVYIKNVLREIYENFSYKKTPKATDLQEWFDLKLIKVWDPITQKWENGFEILSLKP
jgi:hypothetical protein